MKRLRKITSLITKYSILRVNACLTFVCLIAIQIASAQSFLPDSFGYVKDPSFTKLIKRKHHTLVGLYEKKQKGIEAEVKLENGGGPRDFLDLNGNLIPENSGSDTAGDLYNSAIMKHVPFPIDTSSFEIVNADTLYGIRNKKTKAVILPIVYKYISRHRKDTVVIKDQRGNFGLATMWGKIILSPQFTDISPIEDDSDRPNSDWIIDIDGKYGLMDNRFHVITEPRYSGIGLCKCSQKRDIAYISKNSKFGLIKLNGQTIIEPTYDNLSSSSGTEIRVKKDRRDEHSYGIIDSTGKELLAPVYDRLPETAHNLIVFQKDNKKGIINSKGIVLLELTDKPFNLGPFYDNYTVFQWGSGVVSNVVTGVISKDGQWILKPVYTKLKFDSGYIYGSIGNTKFVFDLQGKPIVNGDYDELHVVGNFLFFSKNYTTGLMDFTGKIVKKLPYQDGLGFKEFLIVKKGALWGITNLDGDIIQPFLYKFINISDDGFKVRDTGIFTAYIDKTQYYLDLYGNNKNVTESLNHMYQKNKN